MKVYSEINGTAFRELAWSGARYTIEYLTDDEIDTVLDYLEQTNEDGMDLTDLNDTFAYDDDYIAEILGYEDFEELMKAKDEDEEDR